MLWRYSQNAVVTVDLALNSEIAACHNLGLVKGRCVVICLRRAAKHTRRPDRPSIYALQRGLLPQEGVSFPVQLDKGPAKRCHILASVKETF